MRSLWLLLWMTYPAISAEPQPAAESKPPAQAARGQATFRDEATATHCGACHALARKGTAVGPDLTRLARLSPRAIAMAIRATRTQYVQEVKLKDGSEFPVCRWPTTNPRFSFTISARNRQRCGSWSGRTLPPLLITPTGNTCPSPPAIRHGNWRT